MNEPDTPSTPEQHELIRICAAERVQYILWLADRVEFDPLMYAKTAADELRLLVGDIMTLED